KNITKSYAHDHQPLTVLDNFNLTILPGEFVSIVGSSGCGKSTLLRLIVGLDDEYEGSIQLDGQIIKGTSLQRGIVFQEHRLLPWLSVADNIALALENSSLCEQEKVARIQEHIE